MVPYKFIGTVVSNLQKFREECCCFHRWPLGNVVAMDEESAVGLSQDFDHVICAMLVDAMLCMEGVIPTTNLDPSAFS